MYTSHLVTETPLYKDFIMTNNSLVGLTNYSTIKVSFSTSLHRENSVLCYRWSEWNIWTKYTEDLQCNQSGTIFQRLWKHVRYFYINFLNCNFRIAWKSEHIHFEIYFYSNITAVIHSLHSAYHKLMCVEDRLVEWYRPYSAIHYRNLLLSYCI